LNARQEIAFGTALSAGHVVGGIRQAARSRWSMPGLQPAIRYAVPLLLRASASSTLRRVSRRKKFCRPAPSVFQFGSQAGVRRRLLEHSFGRMAASCQPFLVILAAPADFMAMPLPPRGQDAKTRRKNHLHLT
jgi:hypothetical protein